MSVFLGVIDFDIVKSVITLMDEIVSSGKNRKGAFTINEKPNKFKIEVENFEYAFVFQASSHSKLNFWKNAVL